MDMNKFIGWLNKLPLWLRAIVLVLVAALVLIASISMSSCGITRAVVRGTAEGNVTEIKITTNNPTTVDASPNVSLSSRPE